MYTKTHGFVKSDTWISLSCYMDLSKLSHGFVKIHIWISLSSYMDLFDVSKFGFVKIVRCISHPLPNKAMLKFYQDFQVC